MRYSWAYGWSPWGRWGKAGEEGSGRGRRSWGQSMVSKTQGSVSGVLRTSILGSEQTVVQWRAVGSVASYSTGIGITWRCSNCGSGIKGSISNPWSPGGFHISVHRSGLLLSGAGVMIGWIGVVRWWWTRTGVVRWWWTRTGVVRWWWTRTESQGTCQRTLVGITLSGPWGRRRTRARRWTFGSSTFITRESAVGVEDWGLIPSGGIRGDSMG